jgi:hypothetical protein
MSGIVATQGDTALSALEKLNASDVIVVDPAPTRDNIIVTYCPMRLDP